jgi:hypothetical protein
VTEEGIVNIERRPYAHQYGLFMHADQAPYFRDHGDGERPQQAGFLAFDAFEDIVGPRGAIYPSRAEDCRTS